MDSLYDKYKLELEDCQTSYIPAVGFASWSIEQEGEIYIQDLYVTPEKRNNKQCFELVKKCILDAREKDIDVKVIFTSLDKDLKKYKKCRNLVRKMAFKVQGEDDNTIYFYKEL